MKIRSCSSPAGRERSHCGRSVPSSARFCLLLPILLLAAGSSVAWSLDLGMRHTGLSIGNSPRWTGVRVNLRDSGIQRINGVNLTLWKAHDVDAAVITGVAVGLAPQAGTLRGIQFGLLGVAYSTREQGIAVGGLGVGGDGPMTGLALGGLGVGCSGSIRGLIIG